MMRVPDEAAQRVSRIEALLDEAVRALGVKSRTEAIHVALKEIVALKRFKDTMKKYGGKGTFAGYDE